MKEFDIVRIMIFFLITKEIGKKDSNNTKKNSKILMSDRLRRQRCFEDQV